MIPIAILAILILVVLILYLCRGFLIARLLGLPPPQNKVSVTKDIKIAMPDGAELMTDHYAPKGEVPCPTILIRTPYGKSGLSVFVYRFAERGYHIIVQDVRGRFDSGGTYSPEINEAVDGKATLDWIAKQPWFNGALGTWGLSYLGYVQWAITGDAPPFLKAMVPIMSSPQHFSHTHPEGAFALELRLYWILALKLKEEWYKLSFMEKIMRMSSTLSGKEFEKAKQAFMHLPLLEADVEITGEEVPIYREMISNTNPDLPYWRERDHSANVSQINAPVFLIGGWYDIILRCVLDNYATLKAAGKNPYITIGPWTHSQPQPTIVGLKDGLIWFDAHLKGDRSRLRGKPVRINVMGVNEWREMDEWPPKSQKTQYFLHSDAKLLPEEPSSESVPDSYKYDPADPTPSIGGALIEMKGGGPKDNSELEARSDVLCYTTPPLEEDLEVIGFVSLNLFVRSSLPHTDFFGRLCDVDPKGRSINVCDGLCRIEPGKGEPQEDGSLKIEVDMWATAYRFRKGNSLRLQVSSGAHPRWSRNLGTGEPVPTGTRMEVAEQTIYHDAEHASALILPVT